MANAVPSRIGQQNLTGATDANFLKMFAGEVLTAFAETNVFLPKTMVRTISSGKSAQFPASWKGSAAYHTPGAELVGTAIAHNERVILIDGFLVADRFIAEIDEAMTHYEVRSEYSRDTGRALARTMDKNLGQVLALAARASATVTGANGGTQIVSSTALTSPDAMVQAAFDAQTALDQKDVPQEDRFMAVSPSTYYKLVNSSSKAINRDYNPEGNGSIAEGVIFRIAGLPLVKTNNMPSTVVNTGPAAYQGTFSTTAALVWHRSAIGTVKLRDLSTRMDYDPRRLGTLIVSKYSCGHGILRPESAVEIVTA